MHDGRYLDVRSFESPRPQLSCVSRRNAPLASKNRRLKLETAHPSSQPIHTPSRTMRRLPGFSMSPVMTASVPTPSILNLIDMHVVDEYTQKW